jgi:hypothetical protein
VALPGKQKGCRHVLLIGLLGWRDEGLSHPVQGLTGKTKTKGSWTLRELRLTETNAEESDLDYWREQIGPDLVSGSSS